MFGEDGIGLDDLDRIEREEFVHYVETARALGDPTDWPRFREELVAALTAALGLDYLDGCMSPEHAEEGIQRRQERARDLLEQLHAQHDPATEWPRFSDAVWENRSRLRG